MRVVQLRSIIERIINTIPNNGDNFSFISGFKSIQSSIDFSSPEIIELHCQRCAELMEDYISIDEEIWEPWERQIVDIWMEGMSNEIDEKPSTQMSIVIPSKDTLMKGKICGCGDCKRVFRFSEMKRWKRNGQGPICPYCSAECVVSVDMLHLIPTIFDERHPNV